MPKKAGTPLKKTSSSKAGGKKAAAPQASETKSKSRVVVGSSISLQLPYVITIFKDGLNYRVAVDIHLLSGTAPRDVTVTIEKNEFLNVELVLPEVMFSTGRLFTSGVYLGEDRVAKFEEEVLALRNRLNCVQERLIKSKFKIQLPTKVEDRFFKTRSSKAIHCSAYDLDKRNIDFQRKSYQTIEILHVNMMAQEKLVDFDDDDVDFEAFMMNFSPPKNTTTNKRQCPDNGVGDSPGQNRTPTGWNVVE